ncbi:hypothetical protein Gotur_035050 [Gossypium turneri]
MLRSHWSTMLLSICTRRIECCVFLEYIDIWENRYDHIPTRESIIIPELACTLNYMPWFRIHGKPYLLLKKQMCQQIRVERE